MSFIYAYTISISRAVQQFSQSAGATQGLTIIAASVPASIQLKRDKGFSAPTGFPAPSNTSAPMPMWMIYIPASAGLAQGAVLGADLITDLQSGAQYKVDAASWSMLGWQLACTPYEPTA